MNFNGWHDASLPSRCFLLAAALQKLSPTLLCRSRLKGSRPRSVRTSSMSTRLPSIQSYESTCGHKARSQWFAALVSIQRHKRHLLAIIRRDSRLLRPVISVDRCKARSCTENLCWRGLLLTAEGYVQKLLRHRRYGLFRMCPGRRQDFDLHICNPRAYPSDRQKEAWGHPCATLPPEGSINSLSTLSCSWSRRRRTIRKHSPCLSHLQHYRV
ncbi:hypothetical protein EJ03DRAFT_72195 [Teratosphaeria nubilosa]|uniref:Uncharacterized protein n=1 Tax=Teratosphaeria nubilosa TaxID=161662 RepID=A0A6G1LMY1_9PEZI|nr:hypothetical protein EJ03DRAFT_72195 [Teratosphaeria nubilosa]